MKRKNISMLLMVLLVTGVVLTLATPASATFPGKNGRFAFIVQPDLFTMNPDGSDVRQLTPFGSNEATFGVAWSPDGSQVGVRQGARGLLRQPDLDHECQWEQPTSVAQRCLPVR